MKLVVKAVEVFKLFLFSIPELLYFCTYDQIVESVVASSYDYATFVTRDYFAYYETVY